MLSQQFIARAGQRIARQPAVRSAFRRNYASQGTAQGAGEHGFQGAADNAFNRERAAVKQHAAETSDLWRKLSIWAVIPALLLSGANAYKLWNEHWEHWEHMPALEERPEFPYQNIRVKNFWFGNGDETMFWNSKVNHHKQAEE